ncbi:hypothetical protein F3Y22_tig00110187pilonHSYRG00587 [Hibiscus syriacus]|uniref:Uncharacterized protein n=1 Tax=Hibiscus syriacus TaxID=106335 RepID=A0A6A3BDN6_HIBSY|nr:hypothetical protein F3Y22_tig00110187pilonHSYRG00587 [Hibiscus syriacus]
MKLSKVVMSLSECHRFDGGLIHRSMVSVSSNHGCKLDGATVPVCWKTKNRTEYIQMIDNPITITANSKQIVGVSKAMSSDVCSYY